MKSLLPEMSPVYQKRAIFDCDFLYGEVLLTEGFVQEAIAVCEKALPLEIPVFTSRRVLLTYNTPFLKDVLARAYFQNGKTDKAIAEYERLTTFDPNSKERFLIHPLYHYRLAKLYQEKGAPVKAIDQYETFLEIWKDADEDLPDLIDAQERLAQMTKGN